MHVIVRYRLLLSVMAYLLLLANDCYRLFPLLVCMDICQAELSWLRKLTKIHVIVSKNVFPDNFKFDRKNQEIMQAKSKKIHIISNAEYFV